MSRAAKSAAGGDAANRPEPDRLEGWPRPRENPQLFGHADAAAKFLRAFASGRQHHAWLISGAPGIGKATLAYRLARHVLSGGGSFGQAENIGGDIHDVLFRQVASLSHPGLCAIRRPLLGTGRPAQVIPVDEIRRLKHFFETTAASEWRVAIIDTADDLNVSSANALLKLLEEPPQRTLFLLVCASPARLFTTIRSRCLRLPLRPLGGTDMRRAITQLMAAGNRAMPDDAAMARLIWLAQGSPRRALELLDAGTADLFERLVAILEALPGLDYSALFPLLDKAGGQAGAVDAVLDFLDQSLVAVSRAATGALTPESMDQLRAIGFLRLPGLVCASNLALWAGVWERMNRSRADAGRLNLDRSALLLTVFADLQATAQRARPVTR